MDDHEFDENLSFGCLPREIIIEIFSYLTTDEKKTCALVCKYWRDVCYSKTLWRDVTPVITLTTGARVLESLANRGVDSIRVSEVNGRDISGMASRLPELVSMTIEDPFKFTAGSCEMASLMLLHVRVPSGVGDSLLSSLFAAAPSLCHLSLACCGLSDESVRLIATKLPKLETLVLNNNQNLTDRAVGYITGAACKPGLRDLEKLDLSYCKRLTTHSIQLISNHLKNLRSLDVSDIIDSFWRDGFPLLPPLAASLQKLWVPSCRDESVEHLVQLSSLKSLSVCGILDLSERGASQLALMKSLVNLTAGIAGSITDSCMAQLAKIPSLRRLSMSFCDNISRVGYSYFTGDRAALTHLDVSMCFLDDGVVVEIGKIKTLRSLSLGFCYPLEDGDIDYLTKSLPRLEVLELNGSDDLTDKCLVYIGQNLIKLRTLDVSDCQHVSELAVRELAVRELARRFPLAQIEVNLEEMELDQNENTESHFEE